MLKSEIRSEIRLRKRQFTPERLRELSLCIMQRLTEHPRIVAAKTVLMYYSLPDEPDTHDTINRLASMGKRILLPVVTGEETMILREYYGEKDLQKGSLSIMEPTGEPFTAYEEIDVAVIPGMAFDTNGNRLGRGRGYYDRFLRPLPYIYKIGVCFDFQKLSCIPTDENDVRMQEIL